MMLTDHQSTMLARAKTATFGQLRQQHLSDVERSTCESLVAVGLLKDVVGTTFMYTDAGRQH